MGRAPCCDKANVKKGPWSPEEDAKLKSFIEQNGTGGNWIALPQKIGLKRCGKSCRLRWLNYLRPNIKHGGFSEEEDNIICSLYINIGSRWSIIAAQLPGRTDNDIKNYWNTRLKKKLLGKERKEQQHQPPRASLRQEIKVETTHSFTAPAAATTNMNQHIAAAYWPELPCSAAAIMPVMSSSSPIQAQEYSNLIPSDEDSLKTLLIKLGGRFSDHQTTTMYNPQEQTYANSVNNPMISSSSMNSADTCASQLTNSNNYGVNMFEGGYGDLPIEMVYGNQQQELQGMGSLLYGTINGNGVSSGESSSWGNVSSLDYPQLVSDFENCLPNLPQDHSSFEVSSYFGQH